MNRKKTFPASVPVEEDSEGLSRTDKQRMTEQIGRQLRGMYDGLLNQPVPDRFMDLVSRLENNKQGLDKDS